MDSWVTVYRSWLDAYPELLIIWRYRFDLGRYSGYIDKLGNHCYYYKDDNWVDEGSNPSSEFVHNYGAYDAAKYVLSYLSPETIRQIALRAVIDREYAIQYINESDIDHDRTRSEFTQPHVIMTTATEMLEKEVAEDLWQRYRKLSSELENRDPSNCHAEQHFDTINQAARYVLEPLYGVLLMPIAMEAFNVRQECTNDAASVAWANVILNAIADLEEMDEEEIRQCVQHIYDGNTNTNIQTKTTL